MHTGGHVGHRGLHKDDSLAHEAGEQVEQLGGAGIEVDRADVPALRLHGEAGGGLPRPRGSAVRKPALQAGEHARRVVAAPLRRRRKEGLDGGEGAHLHQAICAWLAAVRLPEEAAGGEHGQGKGVQGVQVGGILQDVRLAAAHVGDDDGGRGGHVGEVLRELDCVLELGEGRGGGAEGGSQRPQTGLVKALGVVAVPPRAVQEHACILRGAAGAGVEGRPGIRGEVAAASGEAGDALELRAQDPARFQAPRRAEVGEGVVHLCHIVRDARWRKERRTALRTCAVVASRRRNP